MYLSGDREVAASPEDIKAHNRLAPTEVAPIVTYVCVKIDEQG
jgi:hypothetical protein